MWVSDNKVTATVGDATAHENHFAGCCVTMMVVGMWCSDSNT